MDTQVAKKLMCTKLHYVHIESLSKISWGYIVPQSVLGRKSDLRTTLR